MMQPNFPHAPVRRLAAAALCLALAACAAVGPDYAPPAVDHPDAWSTPLPGAGSASDPVHWWRAFQDPLLDQLVAQALARNQDLAIARQRLLRSARRA